MAMPLDFGKYQGASEITEKCTFNNFEEYLEFSEILPLDFGKYQGASQITKKRTFDNFQENLKI